MRDVAEALSALERSCTVLSAVQKQARLSELLALACGLEQCAQREAERGHLIVPG